MKKTFRGANLYCINAPHRISSEQMVREAVSGGADIFQLRLKNVPDREFLEQACVLSRLCKKLGALFIVNDRVDIAFFSKADGVHLGQNELSIKFARKLLGDKSVIGISAYSVEEAKQAEKDGADYVGVGAVFATPIKTDCAVTGLELIRAVRKAVKIPIVAIGGIDETNAADCIRAGADICAVVRAVCGAEPGYIKECAKRMRNIIVKAKKAKELNK